MSSNPSSPSESERHILPFRRPGGATAGLSDPRPTRDEDSAAASPVEGLGKYERNSGEDDYRHRMLMNVLAFGLVVLLVVAGVWIADRIALMRKNQDCVLSGRRGCTPVEVQPGNRF